MYSIGDFAKIIGKSVKTLQRWDRENIFKAKRTVTGRRYYTEADVLKFKNKVVIKNNYIYCRVSNASQKEDLKNQKEYCLEYCKNSGIFIEEVLTDIGSGLNYNRKNWNKLLKDVQQGIVENIIVAHKDRFVRFGFDWFKNFCEQNGCYLKVIQDEKLSPEQEIVQDLISIIHVFSCRVYGLRKYKEEIRKEKI